MELHALYATHASARGEPIPISCGSVVEIPQPHAARAYSWRICYILPPLLPQHLLLQPRNSYAAPTRLAAWLASAAGLTCLPRCLPAHSRFSSGAARYRKTNKA